tara:strand:+ start:2355 stop:2618 length:264 start_codon:yes stop_codon:yes gene_type:complete
MATMTDKQTVACVLRMGVDQIGRVMKEAGGRDPLLKVKDDHPIKTLFKFIRKCALRAAHDHCTHSALDIVEVCDEVEALTSKVKWRH